MSFFDRECFGGGGCGSCDTSIKNPTGVLKGIRLKSFDVSRVAVVSRLSIDFLWFLRCCVMNWVEVEAGRLLRTTLEIL